LCLCSPARPMLLVDIITRQRPETNASSEQ
jgi:hypothetical protein